VPYVQRLVRIFLICGTVALIASIILNVLLVRTSAGGAGEGGIAGYRFQRDNAHLFTMWFDMQPILEQLPVKMTQIAEWVAQHQDAFAQVKER
jgi:hypothetical protein